MNIVTSILLCARTRKVFTTLPIHAVAFKETTNSPSPTTPFKYFRGKILLTRQTDYNMYNQFALNTFRHFTNVTTHSPNLPSLCLHHSSFSNLSVASHMSQLVLQPLRCFTNVTAHSPTLISLLLCHRLFTYVTWRAAPVMNIVLYFFKITHTRNIKHLRSIGLVYCGYITSL